QSVHTSIPGIHLQIRLSELDCLLQLDLCFAPLGREPIVRPGQVSMCLDLAFTKYRRLLERRYGVFELPFQKVGITQVRVRFIRGLKAISLQPSYEAYA